MVEVQAGKNPSAYPGTQESSQERKTGGFEMKFTERQKRLAMSTALHEIGHALTIWEKGEAIIRIELFSPAAGHCIYSGKKCFKIAMSGHGAVRYFERRGGVSTPRSNPRFVTKNKNDSQGNDFSVAAEFAEIDKSEAGSEIGKLLKNYQEEIKFLAMELYKNGSLSGEQITRIFDRRKHNLKKEDKIKNSSVNK